MLSFFLLSFLSCALAAPQLSVPEDQNTNNGAQGSYHAENWTVPWITLHWQSPDTGTKRYGPNWPDFAKFDSEIDFAVSMPGLDINCTAVFPLHQLPNGVIPCGESWNNTEVVSNERERVAFKVEKWSGLGERVAELSFMLGIWRGIMAESGVITTYYAETPITANDFSEPTMHLYCVLGQPFDGFRCRNPNKPIPFEAVVPREQAQIWASRVAL